MSLDKMILSLNPGSEGWRYVITNIQDVTDRQSKSSTGIAPPGQSYKNNLLMQMAGQEADIEISFKIHDDGSDKADSSYTSDIITVGEQINYLKNKIHDPDVGATWYLSDSDDIYGDINNPENSGNLEVQLTDMDINIYNVENDTWYDCRFDLVVGESIA